VLMVPYDDRRADPDQIDGSLGLNFFAPYEVWADWSARSIYLKPRDGDPKKLEIRLARWAARELTQCEHPACVTAARVPAVALRATGWRRLRGRSLAGERRAGERVGRRQLGGDLRQGVDRRRLVEPDVLVELHRQHRLEVVALQLGVGPVHHADRALDARLHQL